MLGVSAASQASQPGTAPAGPVVANQVLAWDIDPSPSGDDPIEVWKQACVDSPDACRVVLANFDGICPPGTLVGTGSSSTLNVTIPSGTPVACDDVKTALQQALDSISPTPQPTPEPTPTPTPTPTPQAPQPTSTGKPTTGDDATCDSTTDQGDKMACSSAKGLYNAFSSLNDLLNSGSGSGINGGGGGEVTPYGVAMGIGFILMVGALLWGAKSTVLDTERINGFEMLRGMGVRAAFFLPACTLIPGMAGLFREMITTPMTDYLKDKAGGFFGGFMQSFTNTLDDNVGPIKLLIGFGEAIPAIIIGVIGIVMILTLMVELLMSDLAVFILILVFPPAMGLSVDPRRRNLTTTVISGLVAVLFARPIVWLVLWGTLTGQKLLVHDWGGFEDLLSMIAVCGVASAAPGIVAMLIKPLVDGAMVGLMGGAASAGGRVIDKGASLPRQGVSDFKNFGPGKSDGGQNPAADSMGGGSPGGSKPASDAMSGGAGSAAGAGEAAGGGAAATAAGAGEAAGTGIGAAAGTGAGATAGAVGGPPGMAVGAAVGAAAGVAVGEAVGAVASTTAEVAEGAQQNGAGVVPSSVSDPAPPPSPAPPPRRGEVSTMPDWAGGTSSEWTGM